MSARRRLLLLVTMAAAITTPLAAQQSHFSLRIDVVHVDVAVTRNGRPVRGLGAADFDLFDNGVRQTVDLASFDELPVNAILVLDMSGSVAGSRLADLRRASAMWLDDLAPMDRSALVTFSESVAESAALSMDRARIRAALAGASGHGDTSLFDGAYAGLTLGETDEGRSLVLIFSDGVDSTSWLDPAAVIDAARRGSSVVFAISDSGHRKPPFLHDLTAATGGSLIEIASTQDLDRTFVQILTEFRERYLLGYSPRGVTRDGWHKLEVRLRGAAATGVTINARPGYQTGS